MSHLRTDLAMETFDASGEARLPGVHVGRWDAEDVSITEVVISDPETAEQLGKPCGSYLTLECALLRDRDPDARLAMASLLGEELARMLPGDRNTPVLVVGLGNRFITPDALGPLTVDRTLVTRHMLRSGYADGLRSVSAVAPGVLGVTGVETGEMVRSLVRELKPGAVICIDSLSARDSARIGSTLQLADTGIRPGSGVGNHRKPLTRESLGVDVIAVGMPTVVYAATLARDAFEVLSLRQGSPCDEASLRRMEEELLDEAVGEMIVTPREIDSIVQDAAGIIASGLNRALHPEMSDSEIAALMN